MKCIVILSHRKEEGDARDFEGTATSTNGNNNSYVPLLTMFSSLLVPDSLWIYLYINKAYRWNIVVLYCSNIFLQIIPSYTIHTHTYRWSSAAVPTRRPDWGRAGHNSWSNQSGHTLSVVRNSSQEDTCLWWFEASIPTHLSWRHCLQSSSGLVWECSCKPWQ